MPTDTVVCANFKVQPRYANPFAILFHRLTRMEGLTPFHFSQLSKLGVCEMLVPLTRMYTGSFTFAIVEVLILLIVMIFIGNY